MQLSAIDLAALEGLLAQNAGFWLAFAMMYFALPLADWIIFRRLWRLPLIGLAPILRKRISNELLLSYSGEVYFYFWARHRAGLTNAPFGAIKDVNIVSALVANGVTLGLLGLAYPYMDGLFPGELETIVTLSIAVILAITSVALLFRRRLFTLTGDQLVWVGGIHLARILVTTGLLALVWHLAMPGAPLGLWLELSALRLVVTRLPMLPSKDLLFTSIAIFLLGSHNEVSALLALTAALTLALHVGLAIILAITGFFDRERSGEEAS
ncbi:hypothetical protein GCM10010833_16650 [Blastomonas aquatica]|uniref:Flippase-like domain-containing protein n=1 Tax=Blastomonas aquatica TaxID=1510276 RepID=A0ABQ1JAQ9_9SPHN|nr:hypothetical protein GCM10010833_16650 [Blastomonas aquatica]